MIPRLASLIVALLTPAAQDAADYCPLMAGSTWTYETGDGKPSVMKVIEQTKVGAQDCWKVTGLAQTYIVSEETWLAASKDGVSIHRFSCKSSNPVAWLKSPLKKGEKWNQEVVLGDVKATFSFEVIGEEAVEVPAGKYACIKVKTTARDAEGGAAEFLTWYAKGVGEVKSEFTAGKKMGERKLKKFETAK